MTTYFSLVILLGIAVTETTASEADAAFLLRSADTFKFKAKKTEEIHLSCQNGFFRQFDPTKFKTKENSGNNNVPERPIPSESLNISSEYLEDQNAYKLTITCPIDGDGVLSNDQQLNQAPADGFTQTTEIVLPVQKKAYETQKYVYTKLKSGESYQYSRLQLNMVVGKSKLIIDMDAFTNPDGSQNLKYDKKHQQKVIAQRREEIQQAIKDNTATEEQIEELHRLEMMQRSEEYHNRWDFDGNRRRMVKEKRQKLLEADDRVRTKKRDVKKKEG